MNSITKERIELFIKNPLENGLTRGEQMELARIALASLEAEPVVYMWDSERKDIDAPGYYRTEHLVFAESSVKQWGGRVVPLYTAPPATVVPDERAAFNAWNNDENLPIAGVGAKNAAWLAWQARAELGRSLAVNSPGTPDSWISCSDRMPDSKTAVLVAREFDRKGDWRMKWATYIPGHPDANDGWIIPGASWKPSHWMPLPEPPQEVK
ncbi:TPA: DUF550 domain-containing protein [Escherichia coli]|nr:DUF551 domain-containing protein [Escherichia coli]EEY7957641.1 DUF551 domain-containing protein [Escherichia coli]EFB1317061.1 DUF551 domain-containing protein [Escherichia coli]EFC3751390.1 DUF551 domain-containing protein [Escherichia coli]EFJ3290084.1 DUF551 domain-containing protein [Escherichia coli]